jgi:hypothetical protein
VVVEGLDADFAKFEQHLLTRLDAGGHVALLTRLETTLLTVNLDNENAIFALAIDAYQFAAQHFTAGEWQRTFRSFVELDFDRIAGIDPFRTLTVATRVHQVPRLVRILSRCHRIEKPPHRVEKIVRGHRLAVGPLGVFAEVERVRLLVVRNVPPLGDTRNRRERLRIESRKAFEDVANNPVLGNAGDDGPVERFDFRLVDEREVRRRQLHPQHRPRHRGHPQSNHQKRKPGTRRHRN